MVAAVSEAEVEKLRLYSDPACAQLLRTAAAHFGLQPSQVMPGNGSDENLFFALRAFCDESHPLAFADITYGLSLIHICTQHPLRALGGTRVLLAAAPTTPPCFRRWRRSSSLLRIVSGKNIYNFGAPERLRTLRCSIFTRGTGVVKNFRLSVQTH